MAGLERVAQGRPVTMRPWSGMRPATGFALPEDDPKLGSVIATPSLGGLLGLQESPTNDDAPARQQAGALLAELAALQRSLLGGGDPAAVLQRLDSMLDVVPYGGSPPLLALLTAVRMRARVELARRGRGA